MVRTLADHRRWVYAVTVTPDGQQVLSGCSDGTLEVWELGSGRVVRTLVGHEDKVKAVAVTRDGQEEVGHLRKVVFMLFRSQSGTSRVKEPANKLVQLARFKKLYYLLQVHMAVAVIDAKWVWIWSPEFNQILISGPAWPTMNKSWAIPSFFIYKGLRRIIRSRQTIANDKNAGFPSFPANIDRIIPQPLPYLAVRISGYIIYGAKFMDLNAELSWTAGFNTRLHTVYIGDDFEAVSSAAGGLPQVDTTYTPDPLAKDTVYYWRAQPKLRNQPGIVTL